MTAAPDPRTLDDGTRLAVERTRLAYERTHMAWIRTAASLISFGFTVYKFFEFELLTTSAFREGWLSPRRFGVIMIGTGLASLLFSTIAHRHDLAVLQSEYGSTPASTATVVAVIVLLMGAVAFVAAVLRA